MKRLRVKKMAYNKIINPVTPTADMFRIRNQFSFIELALHARDKAQAQTEEDQQHQQNEQADILPDAVVIQVSSMLNALNVSKEMNNLKRAVRQEQEDNFLDVGTLRRVVLVLIAEEQKDEDDAQNVHVDDVQVERLCEER